MAKNVKDIDVKDVKEVKKAIKVVVTPLVDIGCLKNGKPEFPKGKPCKVSEETKTNWENLKLI